MFQISKHEFKLRRFAEFSSVREIISKCVDVKNFFSFLISEAIRTFKAWKTCFYSSSSRLFFRKHFPSRTFHRTKVIEEKNQFTIDSFRILDADYEDSSEAISLPESQNCNGEK